jgi:hypothetical protein
MKGGELALAQKDSWRNLAVSLTLRAKLASPVNIRRNSCFAGREGVEDTGDIGQKSKHRGVNGLLSPGRSDSDFSTLVLPQAVDL